MATITDTPDDDPADDGPAPPPVNRWWVLVLWAAPLAILLGLGGWWYAGQPDSPDQTAAAEEKKDPKEQEKKPKPDFETDRPAPLPNETKSPLVIAKPGHWSMVTQRMRANYEDFEGQVTHEIVDGQNQPVAIDRTDFSLPSSRPIVLAKGARKSPDTLLFTPPFDKPIRLASVLRNRSSGAIVDESQLGLTRMPAHQYHLVVLAKEPDRYGFLNSLYSVTAPFSAQFEFTGVPLDLAKRNYRMVRPAIDDARLGIALADNSLCWTSTAYMVWDEVDPTALRKEQQDALVDWLHWGGQLIISGPDSLDLLAESFLAPYLPATSAGARSFTAEDLAPLSKTFAVGAKRLPLRPTVKWSGVKLTPHAEATAPAGLKSLLAERSVGRGRIVVTAFQLNERDLLNWKSGFDNFVNAALFRRPPRRFSGDIFEGGSTIVSWADTTLGPFDPELNSKVRFFARDELTDPKLRQPLISADSAGGEVGADGDFKNVLTPPMPGGAAAWTDFSASAGAARQSLREAAGVNIPGAGFVIGCLAVYLLVLAPINWAFFYALGRVELAWVAAPFIALAGALAVVKQAQLDIGFVRAQTEIAVLETQPTAPRGHLTRYTALYTSLSTTYDFEFDAPSVTAMPFAPSETLPSGPRPPIQPVRIERQEKTRLLGLPVNSATTEFVHSEEMRDLSTRPGGGLIVAGKSSTGVMQIENRSATDVVGLALVRRLDKPGPPQVEGVWIGELLGGKSLPYSLRPLIIEPKKAFFAAERAAGDKQAKELDLKLELEPLLALALDPARLAPGEFRAVGRIRGVLPGVTITPKASQVNGAAVLVAHLAYGPLPDLQNDVNAPSDIAK
jgi:hypothetical protein